MKRIKRKGAGNAKAQREGAPTKRFSQKDAMRRRIPLFAKTSAENESYGGQEETKIAEESVRQRLNFRRIPVKRDA
jgi:hypothetical protein